MDYSILLDNISSFINPTNIIKILCIVVGATIGIFLAVWGGKSIIYTIQKILDGRTATHLIIVTDMATGKSRPATYGDIKKMKKRYKENIGSMTEDEYFDYVDKYGTRPGAYDDV